MERNSTRSGGLCLSFRDRAFAVGSNKAVFWSFEDCAQVLTRAEISELSAPGKPSESGQIVDVPLDYFRGRSPEGFAGLGSDIFGRSLNRVLTECDTNGRAVRY